ncbi:MAG: WecB/TagA/CpsF family glycosyltransferase [Acidobacteria bacterium]|nr:WecB/TagA/CpsF family glycosyltransferase [Acidobacteriota bacterium]
MLKNIRKKLVSFWQNIPEPPAEAEPLTLKYKIIIVLLIFSLASLVRYIHFQDLLPLIKTGQQDFAGLTKVHEGFVTEILNKGVEGVFPKEVSPGDTSLLLYPPGYPLFLSGIYTLTSRNPVGICFAQGFLDSITAILIFFIALELFNRTIAIISGLSVAVSHHLAYYSLLLLPDELVSVFVMAGTLLLIRGYKVSWHKEKGYKELFLAGAFYGLSCWFRPNAMLLVVFWIAAFLIMRKSIVEMPKRLGLIVLGTALVIAPITIRNFQLYGKFVPLTLNIGNILQIGLGEEDPSLGLPATDVETLIWDAKTYNRPDYAGNLISPDGFLRERDRVRRSVAIILDRPFWYTGVMLKRINLMTKYSAHAPLVRPELPDKKALFEEYKEKYGLVVGTFSYYSDNGTTLDYFRPLVRALQRIFKEGLWIFIFLGILISTKNFHSWLLIATVPLYYLISQSAMHSEFRYVLPAHCLLFIFYGVAFYTIFLALPRQFRQKLATPDYVKRLDVAPFERFTVPTPSKSITEKINDYDPNIVVFDEDSKTLETPILGKENKESNSFSDRPPRLSITGLPVDNLTQKETLELIDGYINQKQKNRLMVVVNASKLVLAQEDKELREIILNADIVTADGMSVVWASKLLGKPLKERVTGIDTFENLVEMAAQKGYSVYFLGAKPDVVEALVKHYSEHLPNLKIAGYHDGYFGRNEDVIEDIKKTTPDILFVAMGSPRQEKWQASNLAKLGVSFTIGVGGSFDHIAGFSERAPKWMQDVGLEWLYRLAQEPTRLWQRYLIGNTKFILLILREKSKKS